MVVDRRTAVGVLGFHTPALVRQTNGIDAQTDPRNCRQRQQ
jgi:hypothetical protein